MDKEHIPFYVFNTHVEAEDAIQSLNRAGFDVKKLSLIGKGYHSEEHPMGFYTTGDRIKSWGGLGAFWGAPARAGGVRAAWCGCGGNGRACRGRAGERA